MKEKIKIVDMVKEVPIADFVKEEISIGEFLTKINNSKPIKEDFEKLCESYGTIGKLDLQEVLRSIKRQYIMLEYRSFWESSTIFVNYYIEREETDKEYKVRIGKMSEKEKTKCKNEEKEKKNRLKLYKKLKKEFESK